MHAISNDRGSASPYGFINLLQITAYHHKASAQLWKHPAGAHAVCSLDPCIVPSARTRQIDRNRNVLQHVDEDQRTYGTSQWTARRRGSARATTSASVRKSIVISQPQPDPVEQHVTRQQAAEGRAARAKSRAAAADTSGVLMSSSIDELAYNVVQRCFKQQPPRLLITYLTLGLL